jgi:hypothetical protein
MSGLLAPQAEAKPKVKRPKTRFRENKPDSMMPKILSSPSIGGNPTQAAQNKQLIFRPKVADELPLAR